MKMKIRERRIFEFQNRMHVVNLHIPKIILHRARNPGLRGRSNDQKRANRAESIRGLDPPSRPKAGRETFARVTEGKFSRRDDAANVCSASKTRSKPLEHVGAPRVNAKERRRGHRQRSYGIQRRLSDVRDRVLSSEGRSQLADWPCRPTLSSLGLRTTSSPSGSPWPARPCPGCWR